MADGLAVITGASTGIGFALASIAATAGYDVIVAANEPLIHAAARDFEQFGTRVQAVEVDLSTIAGVDTLLDAAAGRPIDIVCANAGISQGGPFVDQDVATWRHAVDTNIVGTMYLVQRALKDMLARNSGKILVTGSIAGYVPGPFNAVYNATKAFIDNITEALRNEIGKARHVTLTTLMPGATETEFFDRADMLDTKLGQAKKADPAKVAQDGWDALMAGRGHVVSGWSNKLQVAAAGVVPQSVLAEVHRKIAEPSSGTR